ncbi:MAG: lysoplasmalogenase [Clostridia bacterium]
MNLLFVLCCSIATVGCIISRLKRQAFIGMIFKFVAAFSFMAIVACSFFSSRANYNYFLFVFLGLLFGLGGDIFLGIKEIAPDYKKKLIPIGILFFLIGHIFYIIAFLQMVGFNYVPLLISAGFAVFGGIMIYLLKMQASLPLKIILILYYLLITYMASTAGYFYVVTSSTGALLALIGSILFVISDSSLSQIYFTNTKFKAHFGVIETATYFSAQILIALSVMYI